MSEAPTPKPRPAPPPMRPPPPASTSMPAAKKTFTVSEVASTSGERVVFYGTGGIGKSSFANEMRNVGVLPIFIDFDKGAHRLDPIPKCINGIETWADARAAIQDKSLFPKGSCLVVDTFSRGEEKASDDIVGRLPDDKRQQGLEGYGYGKGHAMFFDERMKFLADLDRLVDTGVHVVLICHEIRAMVKNPNGEDYFRYEPMLASTDKNPFRDKIKGWADHVLFADYDIAIEDKKATGHGARSVHCQGQPGFVAKSRGLIGPYPFMKDSRTGEISTALWAHLFSKE